MEYVNKKFSYDKNMSGISMSSISNINYSNALNLNDESLKNLNYANLRYESNYEDALNINAPVSVCIIIPTYNEASNIPKLLKLIYGKEQEIAYDTENINMNVLVVDDNSPDGTADVVKEFQKDNLNIHILSRSEKNGLGAAYIAGMQHAMKTLKPDIIFEMDGDLSHDPEYILPMIDKVRKGADFVIGSRYIKGGSIPKNWGMKRKLVSKSANFYAKTILGIKGINDCTGGFRAMKTSALEKIDLNSLKTKGYAFQISLLEEMRRNGVIIEEVPIDFKDRTNGASKMRIYDILEEGLFVLKTGLKNALYADRYPARHPVYVEATALNNVQNQQYSLVNKNVGHQTEFIQTNALNALEDNQIEFKQAFGLTEEPRAYILQEELVEIQAAA